ncbi:hypothetical protein LCGC14_1045920 [marine sediment metagenome]|uniref:Uncharacterized protein n=1 Tax=marine sediment metagenome TaxID=412755 RepID=A0A0F9NC29_9ZZZZ
MKTKEVTCAFCQTKFNKSVVKIKETEKHDKLHACNRSCSAKLSNISRHSAPATRNAEHTRRDKEKFPERDLARKLVQRAIKAGYIEVPEECENCFDSVKLEAHHEEHTSPYLIIFVCKTCHAFFDKNKIFGCCTDYSDQIPQ